MTTNSTRNRFSRKAVLATLVMLSLLTGIGPNSAHSAPIETNTYVAGYTGAGMSFKGVLQFTHDPSADNMESGDFQGTAIEMDCSSAWVCPSVLLGEHAIEYYFDDSERLQRVLFTLIPGSWDHTFLELYFHGGYQPRIPGEYSFAASDWLSNPEVEGRFFSRPLEISPGRPVPESGTLFLLVLGLVAVSSAGHIRVGR